MRTEQERMRFRRIFRRYAWPASFLFFITVCAFHTSPGHAQTLGVLDNIVTLFRDKVAGMEGTLRNIGQNLFLGLVGIEVVIAAGRFIGSRDMVELFGSMVWILVRIGFFWWALLHWPDFSMAIVNSFGQAGNNASTAVGGTANLMPSGIFASGANMASAVWNAMTLREIALSLLLAFAGLVVVVVYAVITALMIEVLVESYLVAYAGLLLMGFGGTRYTQSFAEAQFRYAISVGLKRFLLQLLIGISESLMQDFSTQTFNGSSQATWTSLVAIIAVPIVLLTLAYKIPYKAQDMINGTSSHGGGGVLSAAASVGAAAIAGGAAMFGSGQAVASAFKLAAEQVSGGGQGGSQGESGSSGGSQGSGQSSSSGGVGSAALTGGKIAGRAMGNLTKAAASDVGKRLTGNYAATHGHMGSRMSADMARQRARLQENA